MQQLVPRAARGIACGSWQLLSFTNQGCGECGFVLPFDDV